MYFPETCTPSFDKSDPIAKKKVILRFSFLGSIIKKRLFNGIALVLAAKFSALESNWCLGHILGKKIKSLSASVDKKPIFSIYFLWIQCKMNNKCCESIHRITFFYRTWNLIDQSQDTICVHKNKTFIKLSSFFCESILSLAVSKMAAQKDEQALASKASNNLLTCFKP